MSKAIFSDIKRQLVPQEAVVLALREKIAREPVRKAVRMPIGLGRVGRRVLPLAVCFAVLLTLGVWYRHERVNIAPPLPEGYTAVAESEIRGLPAQDFLVSDIRNERDFDKLVFYGGIEDFLEYQVTGFVAVKVEDRPQKKRGSCMDEQVISRVKVLETVYGEGFPAEMKVTQWLRGGCLGDENSNLLRRGGVYLLPLVKSEDAFIVIGDYNVLFEIDDEGLVHSHSDIEAFQAYDGKEYAALARDIRELTSNEALMLAKSGFGLAVRYFSLAGVQVVSDKVRERTEYGGREFVYRVRVADDFGNADLPQEILVRCHPDYRPAFVKGKDYVLFLDTHEGSYRIQANRCVAVGEDGRIKALAAGERGNAFEGYEGYSVQELKAVAARVVDYYSQVE